MSDEVLPGMAEAVERRRLTVGLGKGQLARAAGISREGLAPILKGYRRAYNDSTIIGLARALRWEIDWYTRLQDGEAPIELDDDVRESQAITDLRREVAELRALVERLGTPADAPQPDAAER